MMRPVFAHTFLEHAVHPGAEEPSVRAYLKVVGTAILFLGDVILGESIGRTDLPGGDDAEMKSTLRMITVSINPDTVLCTGHGQLSTLGYQLQANQYLRNAAMASA